MKMAWNAFAIEYGCGVILCMGFKLYGTIFYLTREPLSSLNVVLFDLCGLDFMEPFFRLYRNHYIMFLEGWGCQIAK